VIVRFIDIGGIVDHIPFLFFINCCSLTLWAFAHCFYYQRVPYSQHTRHPFTSFGLGVCLIHL